MFLRVTGYAIAHKMVSNEIKFKEAATAKGGGAKTADARAWYNVPWKVAFVLHALSWYV